jgi:hypothetical protein
VTLIKLVLLANKNPRERAIKLFDTTNRAKGRVECSGLGAVQVLIEVYFPEAEHIGVVLDILNTHTLAG